MSHTFLIQFFKRKIKKMKVSKFLQKKKKSATKYQTRIWTLTKLKMLLPDCIFTNSLTHLLTEWLIYWYVLIDWCTDWMIYLLTGWMSCCLTYFWYFSGPQNKGMDCALWLSSYYWTSMWESVLGDQLNRASKAPKAGVGECQGADCFEIKPYGT